jgi:hypothetical protein
MLRSACVLVMAFAVSAAMSNPALAALAGEDGTSPCGSIGVIPGCQGYRDASEPILLVGGALVVVALIAIYVFRPRRTGRDDES